MKELWYVSCSPRNPAKIRAEVAELAKLEGQDWNARDAAGKNVTQAHFAKMLAAMEGFEGDAAGKESDFSARDRVAPMKTYGFAYVDTLGQIKITKAGRALIDGQDEQDVFLMQMLKWQYPSAQHRGPEYMDEPATLLQAKKPGFKILPFIFTLRVAKVVGGLTKREIAMFLLPHRQMGGVEKTAALIREYRAVREKKPGRVGKRVYDEKLHRKIFKKVYVESLPVVSDKINHLAELKKKVRNSRDVADACMRLFRYTGIFATQKDKLVLNNTRSQEIRIILSRKWTPVTFYNDVIRFYTYFGDCDKPKLPFYSPVFMARKIVSLAKDIQAFASKLTVQVDVSCTVAQLTKLAKPQLSKRIREFTALYRNLSEQSLVEYLRSPMGQADVLEFYDSIIDRDVADPAAFFEWNTWRAMVAIDEAKKIVPNLKLDDSLQPVDCARGNLSDLVAEFDKYLVAVEVTLSRGRRQYATETEPVTFHVGRYKKHELDSGGSRKVYGLFIAPTIDRHAAQYFHQYVKHLEVPDCGNVTVVPIDLNAWKDICGFANSLGYLKDHALGQLLQSIEESALKAKNGDEWLLAIPGNVSSWKAAIAAVQT